MNENPEDENTRQKLKHVHDPDERACGFIALGASAERRRDWQAAIESYRDALASGSTRTDCLYFANNNLGFCLIQLGLVAAAEGYCLAAIEIEDARHNAYKNLGLVRQVQGRGEDAAFSFIEATLRRPEDTRAKHLLSDLLTEQPALLSGSTELRRVVEDMNRTPVFALDIQKGPQ